jgi:hypothetical protein
MKNLKKQRKLEKLEESNEVFLRSLKLFKDQLLKMVLETGDKVTEIENEKVINRKRIIRKFKNYKSFLKFKLFSN